MYVKILAGITIVFICTFFGRIRASKLKQRKEFFAATEKFFIYLKRAISFSSASVGDAIKEFSCDNTDALTMLNSYLANKAIYPQYLGEDEQRLMSEFFEKIGRCDKANEIEMLNYFIDEIGKIKNTENIKYAKMSKIFIKLGFFVGLIIFIFIM